MNFGVRSAFARRAAALLALVCAIWTVLAAPALAAEPAAGRTPRPVIERGLGEACVAETDFMRRNHMRLLEHRRDETVHRGVRDPKSSLTGCIACHAGTTSGSVAVAKTDFCVACHSYAAVKVDCFGCHASKPAANAPRPAAAGGAGTTRLAASPQRGAVEVQR